MTLTQVIYIWRKHFCSLATCAKNKKYDWVCRAFQTGQRHILSPLKKERMIVLSSRVFLIKPLEIRSQPHFENIFIKKTFSVSVCYLCFLLLLQSRIYIDVDSCSNCCYSACQSSYSCYGARKNEHCLVSIFVYYGHFFFLTIWQDHAQKHSSETCYFINKDSSLQSWAY